ncbi:Tubulin polyglutamylase complex subunit 2 [Batrachochytrium dendrobatidis]
MSKTSSMSLESMNIQHTSSALHMYQEWMPGVIPYLESCPDVTDLKIAAYPPCPHALVSRWTCTHGQNVLTLPSDLVQFLKCSDGLLFTWNVEIEHSSRILGRMHIKSLVDMIQIDSALLPRSLDRVEYVQNPSLFGAFVLDECKSMGQVCLCYGFDTILPNNTRPLAHNPSLPTVWFRVESTSEWVFVAYSFTAYFRLMVAHLGILGWQMGYSAGGLSPFTSDWLCFYAPSTAMLHRQHRVSQSIVFEYNTTQQSRAPDLQLSTQTRLEASRNVLVQAGLYSRSTACKNVHMDELYPNDGDLKYLKKQAPLECSDRHAIDLDKLQQMVLFVCK